MWKKILFWVVAFIVIIGILFGLAKWGQKATAPTVYPEVSVLNAGDHTKGLTIAKAILIEYGDFQCQACALYEPIIVKLAREMGDKMVLVYRNYPLPKHQFAIPAARSAEAAGLQGKYWEMHDKIFAEQSTWSKQKDAAPTFAQYAKDIGLDMDRYQKDLDSDAVSQKIKDDQASAARFSVSSTPSFFLNGKLILPQSYDDFKNLVASAVSV